jgi:hypothetical protein
MVVRTWERELLQGIQEKETLQHRNFKLSQKYQLPQLPHVQRMQQRRYNKTMKD